MSRKSSGVAFPPTPAPSSKIAAQDKHHPKADFELPPPAMRADGEGDEQDEQESSSSGSSTPTSSYHPASPNSPPRQPSRGSTTARRRSSAGESVERNAKGVELPPPPTRARKIIQMKPKSSGPPDAPPAESTGAAASSKTRATAAKSGPSATNGTKRKAASGTTQNGRKIARKTAHSLIERRRRFKMNEEFGVLKDLVPACEGIEMHKLAILQAAIEYVRYLHQCIEDLQSGKEDSETAARIKPSAFVPPQRDTPYPSPEFAPVSPSIVPSERTSPAFPPVRHHRPSLTASIPTSTTSTTPSPVILANQHHVPEISMKDVNNGPVRTGAEENASHEATAAALLMLNSDRRGLDLHAARGAKNIPPPFTPVEGRKRMSVEDLLSR